MKLIAGLGNVGEKYQNTRHNLGFVVVDDFIRDEGLTWEYSKDLMCYLAKSHVREGISTKITDYVACKPKTFMNMSGESIAATARFYKINLEDILVIHDELDLPFGKTRLSFGGLSAGHRGVESAIRSLGTPEFGRLRIGIDSPRGEVGKSVGVDGEKYVLEKFSEEQMEKLPQIVSLCREAIRSFLVDGVSATMNRFN